MKVSLPEKTLEHWASQYVTHRYRTRAALWWPTAGQDIEVGRYPNRLGKAIQIELKTCKHHRTKTTNYQIVQIDLGQLCDYLRRPLWEQPFYAFPRAAWVGDLEEYTHRHGGPAVTDHAYRRSEEWWFAHWLVVMTARDVAAVLDAEVRAQLSNPPPRGSFARGHRVELVRYEVHHRRGLVRTSWRDGSSPTYLGWRDFWSKLETCGTSSWPQVVWLPEPPREDSARGIGPGDGIPYSEVMPLIWDAVSPTVVEPNQGTDERISSVRPDEDDAGALNDVVPYGIGDDGVFRPIATREGVPSTSPGTDRRVGVALDFELL
ncbi:Uncharacterised protein (plasmid) [Tsukamurella tyrosinosolvens]|uniref:Uncharacterized protein n=1 Tax=Tsukamurella tyrosinosolvens TaxID=57704 RepID=A0A1H4WI85_TSUTY|nr:hypothetical protein SAMN04489793_3568 [Tsukamurella tyrosinosolvens]VEH89363.1 Uncharacterised protein [Tsukamurella tyrosinosolvens]